MHKYLYSDDYIKDLPNRQNCLMIIIIKQQIYSDQKISCQLDIHYTIHCVSMMNYYDA